MRSNLLKLNSKKTTSMLIGTKPFLRGKSLDLKLDDVSLRTVTQAKLLGVIIDENLTWGPHVDCICKYAWNKVHCIRRMSNFLSLSVKKKIYQGFVYPTFDYCDVVWSNASKSSLSKLDKVHNFGARVITNSSPLTSSLTLFNTLGFSTLEERRRYHYSTQVFRCVHGLFPAFLRNTFCFTSEVTGRSSRNQHQLFLPQPCINAGKNRFGYKGVLI